MAPLEGMDAVSKPAVNALTWNRNGVAKIAAPFSLVSRSEMTRLLPGSASCSSEACLEFFPISLAWLGGIDNRRRNERVANNFPELAPRVEIMVYDLGEPCQPCTSDG
jgi:hypothetical protein